jgi:tRNA pseudouridine38-40 synthase
MSESTTETNDDGSGLRRARFVVAYLGTEFHGFASNPGVRTVMGDLTDAMSTVLRRPVGLTAAGRTDAGVHGWGQVLSGDLPAGTDLEMLARRVNKLCAPAISMREAEWAMHDFDARFSATSRRYRYHVWNDAAPNPLIATTSWHVPHELDVEAMRMSLSPLRGEHDFASFCRRPKVGAGVPAPSLVRILHDLSWTRPEATSLLRFDITGSAFCHQMVRSIVGTTVDVGLGRISPEAMPSILAAKDRAAAGAVAPPTGLVLWSVGYDGERWDADRVGT